MSRVVTSVDLCDSCGAQAPTGKNNELPAGWSRLHFKTTTSPGYDLCAKCACLLVHPDNGLVDLRRLAPEEAH